MPIQHTHKTNSIITYHAIINKHTDNVKCSIAYLDVIVRVPVRVIDDDGVSRGKIDAQTTSSGRQEESKLRSTRSCWNETHKYWQIHRMLGHL